MVKHSGTDSNLFLHRMLCVLLFWIPADFSAAEPQPPRFPLEHLENVTLATSTYYPYVNEQGEGLSTDLYRAIFSSVGINVRVQLFPRKRIMRMLLSGESDMAVAVTALEDISPEQRSRFDLIPGIKLAACWFYYKPAHPQISASKELEEMANYQLGTITTSPLRERYKAAGLTIKELETLPQLVEMTVRGRLDFFESTLIAGLLHIRKHYPERRNEFGFSCWNHEESTTAFLNDSQRSKNIKALFDQGLQRIIANGQMMEILESYWGKNNVPSATLPDAIKHLGVDPFQLEEFWRGERDAQGRLIPSVKAPSLGTTDDN